MNSIEIRGLEVNRGGHKILQDLSVTIAERTVTGLLGPSGSGKTTLIRSIVGVQKIARGSVQVLGRPAGSAELRRTVGYVAQTPSVYRDLTVIENLRYFASILDAPARRVDEVTAAVALERQAGLRVDRLSGGEQSRVSLAVALLGNPQLLVLDEPTVGLDPVLREELWALFHRLAASGATLLVSSHVMEEAARCQRLLLLREGRVIVDDTPEGLLQRTGAAGLDAAFLQLIEPARATV